MKKRKRKDPRDLEENKDQQVSRQGEWISIKEALPPFFKTVRIKLKSGTILEDCARIPDMDDYTYVHGTREQRSIGDEMIEWLIPLSK